MTPEEDKTIFYQKEVEKTMFFEPAALVRLVVAKGKEQGREYRIEKDLTRLGRLKENDISIEDNLASRFHAELKKENDEYLIRDLGSSNGTKVNGEWITEKILKDRDEIEIGENIFTFRKGGESLVSEKEVPAISFKLPSLDRKKALILGVLASVLVLIVGVALLSPPPDLPEEEKEGAMTEAREVQEEEKPLPSVSLPRIETPTGSLKKEEINKYYKDGLKYYNSNRLSNAIKEWKKILALDPDHEAAKIKLERAKELFKEQVASHYNQGLKDFQYLRYSKATTEWKMVLKLINDPEDALYKKTLQNIEEAKGKIGR